MLSLDVGQVTRGYRDACWGIRWWSCEVVAWGKRQARCGQRVALFRCSRRLVSRGFFLREKVTGARNSCLASTCGRI